MKRYYTLYYLLFMIMITGAFASMAQNNYGLKLIGLTCLGFACLFFFEALLDWKRKIELSLSTRILLTIELLVLGALALLLFFRSNFIDFNEATMLFSVLLIILTSIYIIYLIRSVSRWWSKSKSLSTGLALYFLVLVLFLATSILMLGVHSKSTFTGIVGIFCLVAFGLWVVVSKKIIVEGERMSIVSHIWKMNNKSFIVLVASLAIGLYFVLNRSNFIPPLYTNEKPAGYLKLIKEAEEGTENIDEEQRTYKLFDQRYQSFIKKYDR